MDKFLPHWHLDQYLDQYFYFICILFLSRLKGKKYTSVAGIFISQNETCSNCISREIEKKKKNSGILCSPALWKAVINCLVLFHLWATRSMKTVKRKSRVHPKAFVAQATGNGSTFANNWSTNMVSHLPIEILQINSFQSLTRNERYTQERLESTGGKVKGGTT